MVIAEIGGTGFNIMMLLHVLAAIVGFAPAWLWPILLKTSAKGDSAAAEAIETSILRYSLPGVGLAGFFGFGLAGMSDKVYKMSQPWLAAAIVVWLILLAVYAFVARPAIKELSTGDASAKAKLSAAVGISHLGLIILLVLMIFKPGL